MNIEYAVHHYHQEAIIENIRKQFKELEARSDGFLFVHKKASDLTAIISFNKEGDGQVWKHISIARQKRMPSYQELEEYKQLFCGEDKYALIVFPPKEMWVSIHKYCVHLWEPMELYPLPEFSGIKYGIKSI